MIINYIHSYSEENRAFIHFYMVKIYPLSIIYSNTLNSNLMNEQITTKPFWINSFSREPSLYLEALFHFCGTHHINDFKESFPRL